MRHAQKNNKPMKINTGILFVLMFAAIAFVLGFGATDLWAKGKKEMVELDEAEIFFEENATDKDLGIQIFLDGDAWTRIKIYDPRWRKILDVKVYGSVGLIGLTELFSESAEPSYVGRDRDMSREELLNLFTAGTYRIYGRTTEGDWLHGKAELTKVIPCAPEIEVNANAGIITVEWEEVEKIVYSKWDPQNEDDDQLCVTPERVGEELVIVGYEAVFEAVVEDESGEERELVNTATLSPDTTSFTASPEFVQMVADARAAGKLLEYKVEVIAIEESNNKGITEEVLWPEDD